MAKRLSCPVGDNDVLILILSAVLLKACFNFLSVFSTTAKAMASPYIQERPVVSTSEL